MAPKVATCAAPKRTLVVRADWFDGSLSYKGTPSTEAHVKRIVQWRRKLWQEGNLKELAESTIIYAAHQPEVWRQIALAERAAKLDEKRLHKAIYRVLHL